MPRRALFPSRRRSQLPAGMLLAVLLAGCGDDPNGPGGGSALTLSPGGPLVMDGLGELVELTATIAGTHGVAVAVRAKFESADTSVITVSANGVVRGVGAGTTHVTARISGLADTISVTVFQTAESLELVRDSTPILLATPLAPLPIACHILDRHGFPLPDEPSLESSTGAVVGATCADAIGLHSGPDTLVLSSGPLELRVPVVLALRPTASSPLGSALAIDSLPQGMVPWAPTLIRNAQGDLDLYLAGYFPDSTAPTGYRGDLHRLESTDGGATFHYDGVALQRDATTCSPAGDGIENVEIVPRPGGMGWRMFYAAGGFTCYGWQIYSAVSTDQRVWTPELGVRVDNGGAQPPDPPGPIPWPAGEGIVIDRLPSGEWRMITGSYERITPREDKFQIIDWRSPDQLTWTYQGPLLTTDGIGPEVSRSIYSPTIREFTSGLFRMIFTGDNLNQPGGRSRLYSAVSLDKVHWQVEGVLLGGSSTDIQYSTLVGDLLVFIRTDLGQPRFIGAATVAMP